MRYCDRLISGVQIEGTGFDKSIWQIGNSIGDWETFWLNLSGATGLRDRTEGRYVIGNTWRRKSPWAKWFEYSGKIYFAFASGGRIDSVGGPVAPGSPVLTSPDWAIDPDNLTHPRTFNYGITATASINLIQYEKGLHWKQFRWNPIPKPEEPEDYPVELNPQDYEETFEVTIPAIGVVPAVSRQFRRNAMSWRGMDSLEGQIRGGAILVEAPPAWTDSVSLPTYQWMGSMRWRAITLHEGKVWIVRDGAGQMNSGNLVGSPNPSESPSYWQRYGNFELRDDGNLEGEVLSRPSVFTSAASNFPVGLWRCNTRFVAKYASQNEFTCAIVDPSNPIVVLERYLENVSAKNFDSEFHPTDVSAGVKSIAEYWWSTQITAPDEMQVLLTDSPAKEGCKDCKTRQYDAGWTTPFSWNGVACNQSFGAGSWYSDATKQWFANRDSFPFRWIGETYSGTAPYLLEATGPFRLTPPGETEHPDAVAYTAPELGLVRTPAPMTEWVGGFGGDVTCDPNLPDPVDIRVNWEVVHSYTTTVSQYRWREGGTIGSTPRFDPEDVDAPGYTVKTLEHPITYRIDVLRNVGVHHYAVATCIGVEEPSGFDPGGSSVESNDFEGWQGLPTIPSGGFVPDYRYIPGLVSVADWPYRHYTYSGDQSVSDETKIRNAFFRWTHYRYIEGCVAVVANPREILNPPGFIGCEGDENPNFRCVGAATKKFLVLHQPSTGDGFAFTNHRHVYDFVNFPGGEFVTSLFPTFPGELTINLDVFGESFNYPVGLLNYEHGDAAAGYRSFLPFGYHRFRASGDMVHPAKRYISAFRGNEFERFSHRGIFDGVYRVGVPLLPDPIDYLPQYDDTRVWSGATWDEYNQQLDLWGPETGVGYTWGLRNAFRSWFPSRRIFPPTFT